MRYLFILSFLCLLATHSFADIVNTGNKQYYGSVSYIDKEKIILKVGCSGETKMTFFWSQNISVSFNTICKHPGSDISRSPITAENNCKKKTVFRFLIKKTQQAAYAESFNASNGTLTIIYINNQGTKTMSFQDIENYIEWVMLDTMCEADIPLTTPKL